MSMKSLKLLALCTTVLAVGTPAMAQGTMAANAALGAAPSTLGQQRAENVLLSSVKTVLAQNPQLADSVGDRALVEAVRHVGQTDPGMLPAVTGVAKQLKPHLGREIEMAAANPTAFDGAVAAMDSEAPAWASAPATAAPVQAQGNAFAGQEPAPEWATASVPTANDASGSSASSNDILDMDLESLMDTKVVTASKSKERAFDVPAAIYVISNEDLRRSGHRTVMDALRMVPGLQVSQISSPSYSVGSRGFGDEYANKLLVMIDGRSIYTPIFSGVFWDMVNVPLEDVDRIEVIRGPGATIWGANAVNGVINIVTKEAKYTQGAYLSGGAGNHERAFGEGRVGGKLGDAGHYRMYSSYHDRNQVQGRDEVDQNNGWWRQLAGFRADWKSTSDDSFTVQSEIQHGGNEQETIQSGIDEDSRQTNAFIRTKWDRVLSEDSSISLSSYLDHDRREVTVLDSRVTNFDLDFNHNLRLGDRNELIWGLGYRVSADEFINSATLSFTPADDVKNLYSAFLQDKFEIIDDTLDFTLGSKFEHNDYTGFEIQPTAKFSYRPSEKSTLWGSVARAVRTPSRVEDSINIIVQQLPAVPPATPPTNVVAQGNQDVESEELIAYEMGYRISPREGLIFDLATYYNDYENLTTLTPNFAAAGFDPGIGVIVLPVNVDNLGKGSMYGAELSVTWQVLPSWKLAGAYSYGKLETDTPTAADSLFLGYEDLWPQHMFNVRSYYNITDDLEFDAALYYVTSLDDAVNVVDNTPRPIDSYLKGDLRLGWRPMDGLELSLAGLNLIEGDHDEFIDSRFNRASLIGRSYYGKATWHF